MKLCAKFRDVAMYRALIMRRDYFRRRSERTTTALWFTIDWDGTNFQQHNTEGRSVVVSRQ